VKRAVSQLVECYRSEYGPRVFVSSTELPVYYEHSSVLEVDLVCLEQLLSADADWRLFVNTAGSELPLATFHVAVAGLNGASSVDSFVLPHVNYHRINTSYEIYRWDLEMGQCTLQLYIVHICIVVERVGFKP
jgi:hypothetical protein